MKIDILTLFPNMFDGFLNESIIKRAREKGLIEINIHDIRDYTLDHHKKVDDYPYGGGRGMVLMCQPVVDAIESLKKEDSKVILMCPQGIKYEQKVAYTLKHEKHLILVCGHYEGYDERIREFVDLEISIGDFDEVTATKYKKMLEDLSVATMTITELDIQVALMKFWIKFKDMYEDMKIDELAEIF